MTKLRSKALCTKAASRITVVGLARTASPGTMQPPAAELPLRDHHLQAVTVAPGSESSQQQEPSRPGESQGSFWLRANKTHSLHLSARR